MYQGLCNIVLFLLKSLNGTKSLAKKLGNRNRKIVTKTQQVFHNSQFSEQQIFQKRQSIGAVTFSETLPIKPVHFSEKLAFQMIPILTTASIQSSKFFRTDNLLVLLLFHKSQPIRPAHFLEKLVSQMILTDSSQFSEQQILLKRQSVGAVTFS